MDKKLVTVLLVLTTLFATSCGTAKEIPDLTSDSLEPTSITTIEDPVLVDVPEPVETTTLPTSNKTESSDSTPAKEAGAPVATAAAPASPTLIGNNAENVTSVTDYLYDDAYMFNPYGYAVVGVKTDGVMKYGMIREDGTYIIKPQFEAFHSTMKDLYFGTPENDIGYVWFQKDGLWGFVNEKCEWVLEPTYEDCTCFSSLGLAGVKVDGKWGFVATSGAMVVDPSYDKVQISHTGKYADVCIDGKWGLVGPSGEEVLVPCATSPVYTEGEMSELGDFRADGQEIALINDGRTLIALDGRIIIDDAKRWIWGFSPNHLTYADSKTSGNGYFNIEGKLVIPLMDDEHGYPFSDDGIAIVYQYLENQTFAAHYIDSQGNTLFDKEFEDLYPFAPNGLAAVAVDGKYGYINKNGEIVIEPEYDYAYTFYADGYAKVGLDDKEAIIDSNGNLMTGFVYDEVTRLDPLTEGSSLFAAEQDGQFGIIDVNGNWILPLQYDYIIPFRPGVDEGWNIISYSGTTYAMSYNDGKYGILSMQGGVLLDPISERQIIIAPNGYVVIETGGKFGYVDLDG